jgi:type IV secretion system protein VirB1
MLPGVELLACPNLAVSSEVMQHIVHIESSANPYAIGVVGGRLERQPKTLPEALATVRMLDDKGYNFSVGLAQVNRANLGRYGLDTYEKAFSACGNISAGAQILAACYADAHGDWGKAFSCYYSGNFTTGFRDGYVQKIYDSINREGSQPESTKASRSAASDAIALRSQPAASRTAGPPGRTTDLQSVTVYAPRDANYRIALRSMAIDAVAAATVPGNLATPDRAATKEVSASLDLTPARPVDASFDHAASASTDHANASTALVPTEVTPLMPAGGNTNDAVFVPEVRGPNDPMGISTSAGAATTTAQTTLSQTSADHADLSQEQRDDAFVF